MSDKEKKFSENELKHLEFIQNVITRMNTNSFHIKGMAIAVFTALVAIFISTSNMLFIFIGVIPTLLFWGLDAYYLLLERRFRGVYNDVVGITNFFVVKNFDMPLHNYTKKGVKDKEKGKTFSYLYVLFSKTIYTLYLSIVIVICLSFLLNCFSKTC